MCLKSKNFKHKEWPKVSNSAGSCPLFSHVLFRPTFPPRPPPHSVFFFFLLAIFSNWCWNGGLKSSPSPFCGPSSQIRRLVPNRKPFRRRTHEPRRWPDPAAFKFVGAKFSSESFCAVAKLPELNRNGFKPAPGLKKTGAGGVGGGGQGMTARRWISRPLVIVGHTPCCSDVCGGAEGKRGLFPSPLEVGRVISNNACLTSLVNPNLLRGVPPAPAPLQARTQEETSVPLPKQWLRRTFKVKAHMPRSL